MGSFLCCCVRPKKTKTGKILKNKGMQKKKANLIRRFCNLCRSKRKNTEGQVSVKSATASETSDANSLYSSRDETDEEYFTARSRSPNPSVSDAGVIDDAEIFETVEQKSAVTTCLKSSKKSPVSVLNDYYIKNNVEISYIWYCDQPVYIYQASSGNHYGYGKGPTKRMAKHNAAADLVGKSNL